MALIHPLGLKLAIQSPVVQIQELDLHPSRIDGGFSDGTLAPHQGRRWGSGFIRYKGIQEVHDRFSVFGHDLGLHS